MTNEVLIGYMPSTRRYFLQACVGCIALCVVMLFFGDVSLIALLLVIASLTGELWWSSRKPWSLEKDGLLHGSDLIPWSDIQRYTKWGPFGIPWTPIKIQGITIYFNNCTTLCVSSRAPAYEACLRQLESMRFTDTPEPLWYNHPPKVLRTLRYTIAFMFAITCFLVFALSYVIIIVAVIVGYFLVQSFIQGNRTNKAEILPHDAWIAGAGSLILFCLLYYIFQSPYLLFAVIAIPTGLILWFPWQPSSVASISECLFVGKKNAYPFRHLRTVKMTSRFFFLKVWQLSFANGEVNVLPFLENFDTFRNSIERQWNEVQHRYRNKKMTEEEEKVRTPNEEARRINFFSADQIPLVMPLSWQILVPSFFLIHSSALALILWCIYTTPVGRFGVIGLFLHTLIPIIILVYGSYLAFSILPRLFRLYKQYLVTEDGIIFGTKHFPWEQIQTIVPYETVLQQKRAALLDVQGRNILEIYGEMSDYEMAFDKIRTKVQQLRHYDPVFSGNANILQNKNHAWHHSRRWAMMIIMLIIVPFTIQNVIQNQYELFQDTTIPDPFQQGYLAVTEPASYFLPGVFGEKFAVIPYQDYTGETWYALGCTDEGIKARYQNTKVRYLPLLPIYGIPLGDVQDIRIVFSEWLENHGITSSQMMYMEEIILQIGYVFWGLAILFLILGLLRQNLFAGLLLQRIPAPLGPDIFLSGTVILNNTLKLVLHGLAAVGVGLYIFASYFPTHMPSFLKIDITGIWIVSFMLLPILFCWHLAYCVMILLPQWSRSFKTWKLTDDGISDGHCKLFWHDIRAVSILQIPCVQLIRWGQKSRKIALIQSSEKQICLDGTLSYFDNIVAHIRQKTHLENNAPSKAKYFYRRRYARVRLALWITCLAMFTTLILSLDWIRQKQDQIWAIPNKTHIHVEYKALDTLVIFSYKDGQEQHWYGLGWNAVDSQNSLISIETKHFIYYHPEYPMFWENATDGIISTRYWTKGYLDSFIDFVQQNAYIETGKYYAWIICLLIFGIPILWHIIGMLLGIPTLEPKN